MLGSEDHWSKAEALRWQICLFLGTAAVYTARITMPLTMPQVAHTMRWSKTQSGTVLSCFFWGYTLTQVLGGYISDTVGGDLVVVSSALGWTLLTLLTPFIIWFFGRISATLGMVVLIRIAMGAFQGVHFPAMASLSSQYLNENERTGFFGVVSAGSSVGAIVCGSVDSVVLEYYGWESVFFIAGFLGLSWVCYTHYGLIRYQRRKSQVVSVSFNLVQKQVPQPPSTVPWSLYLKSPAFWSTVVAHVSSANCWHQLVSWLPTYFYENFDGAQGWVFNVIPWTMCLVGVWVGRRLSDRMLNAGFSVSVTRKCMEFLSQGIQATCLFSIGHTRNYPMSVFLMSAAVGANGFHHNGVLVNPQDIAPKHSGSVFGIMNMAGAIPGFVGVYIAGHILEATHNWAAVFQLTAAINIIGLTSFLLFGTGEPIYQ